MLELRAHVLLTQSASHCQEGAKLTEVHSPPPPYLSVSILGILQLQQELIFT